MLRHPTTHSLELNFSLGADLEIEIGSDGTAAIPDAALLFNADFRKAGKDLLIVGEDGRRAIVHDYFADEKRATLMSREGASVLGSIVDAIVRQTTPAEYAQAGGQAPSATPIGRVEKVTGSAIAIRNGVPVALNVGDLVYQGDVVQTRGASSLGIGLIDGTAFNLSANARMVLNEMVYDPNGTSNSSLISLVNGTIGFVAGQVAKTGDMKVQTPVATMGIRGTIVIVEISANNGPTKIASVFDPHTGQVGEIVAWENGNRSNVLATIASEDRAILLTPHPSLQVIVTEVPRTAADQLLAQNVVRDVLAIQTAFQANPMITGAPDATSPGGSNTGGGAGGSGGLPADLAAGNTSLVGALVPSASISPVIPTASSTATSSEGGTGGIGGGEVSAGAPVLRPDQVPSHQPSSTAAEGLLTFIDRDALDTHVASTSLNLAGLVWTRGGESVSVSPPSALVAALQNAFAAAIGTESSGSSEGTVRWSFSLAAELKDFLGSNEALVVPYLVTVRDKDGQSSTQTVSILLTGANDAPTVALDSTSPHPLSELTGITGAVDDHTVAGTVAFDDVDLADSHHAIASLSVLTWTRSDGTSATGVFPQATLDALRAAILLGGQDSTGSAVGSLTWTFSVSDALFDFLAADERLTIVYEIGVDDGQGGRVTQPVTIVVTGTNDGPVFAAGVVTGGTETETTLTVTGQIAFSDPDRGDIHIASAAATAGTFGTLTAAVTADFTGTGSGGIVGWFYQADQAFVQALAEGEIKSESFIVTLGDDKGQTTTETVIVTLVGENDGATAAADTGSTTEDSSVTINVLANDSDPDASDVLTVTAATVTSGFGTASVLGNQVVYAAGSAYNYLAVGESASVILAYTISDGHGRRSTADVTVTVTGTNDTPTISLADDAGAVTEDANSPNLSDTGTMTFDDVDLIDTHVTAITPALANSLGGTLTASVTDPAAGAGTVTWTYTVANSATQYLADGETATESFTIRISDNKGGFVDQLVTVTVTGTNDTPVLIVATGNAGNANDAVLEAGLAAGSAAAGNGEFAAGTFTLADADGLDDLVSVTINGITLAVGSFAGSEFDTAAGKLTITSYNALTGVASYSYELEVATTDVAAVPETDVFTVSVSDGTVLSAPTTISIEIVDDVPSISATGVMPTLTVDETNVATDDTESFTANFLSSFGADGAGTISYALGALDGPSGLIDTATNSAVNLVLNGPVVEGRSASGNHLVFTLSVNGSGNLTLDQLRAIKHPDSANPNDAVTLSAANLVTLTGTIIDGDGDSASAVLNIGQNLSFQDDFAVAEPIDKSIIPTNAQTNLMLIVDVSGSMGDPSGLTGLNRLNVMKAAVNELLEQYDNGGNVMVRLVVFSSGANAIGAVWTDAATAKDQLAALLAGGATNYDAALLSAMDAFDDAGKLTGADVQNISYFISDGDPTANQNWPGVPGTQTVNGIQPNEQAAWETFLTSNNMVSFALGIPNVAVPANLEPIAFDPAAGTQQADTPIIITDMSQLGVTLVQTIPPANGNLLLDSLIDGSFGADGGYVKSITVGGVAYTFDPVPNTVTPTGVGTSTLVSYDNVTKTIVVDTNGAAPDGELELGLLAGDFSFQAPAGFVSETVDYVFADKDGDTAGDTLTLSVAGGAADHAPIVRDDKVITNIDGGGALIVIPTYALLWNDRDLDGDPIDVTAAGSATDGSIVPAGSPIVTVTFTDNGDEDGGTFTYTGSTTSPVGFDTGVVTVDRAQDSVNPLVGTGLSEILIGRDGANDTINANEGNDVLIGGTGNDTLNGGAGADLLVGGGGSDTASYANATAGVSVSLAITSQNVGANQGIDSVSDDIENLLGSVFNDQLTGDENDNVLTGGDGGDLLKGGTGNDALNGGAGNDILTGDAGNDALNGGADNDTYVFALTDGTDTITETGGTDAIIIQSSGAVLTGLTFNDSDNGDDGGNAGVMVNGTALSITVHNHFEAESGAAGDRVENLTFFGGASFQGFDLGSAAYALSADDTSPQQAVANTSTILIGDGVGSTLTGSTAKDLLFGNDGNDSLSGAAASDYLSGGAGNDTLSGGAGSDWLSGGAGSDRFAYTGSNEGPDTIIDFASGDQIQLQNTAFALGSASNGTLDASRFVSKSSAAGVSNADFANTNQRFLFNSVDSILYYDPDGSGATAALQIARLDNSYLLTHTDILVV